MHYSPTAHSSRIALASFCLLVIVGCSQQEPVRDPAPAVDTAHAPGEQPTDPAPPAAPVTRNYAGESMLLLSATNLKGGLVVHVGCGAGELTLALGASKSLVVHALDTDASKITEARERIAAAGEYGRIAADHWDGKALPYADDLVNLFVVEDRAATVDAEFMRALAPGGSVFERSADGGWNRKKKPKSEALDEWTHHLHGPGGNPVGDDKIVGPPRHLRWTAGPLWARSHGWTPSVSALVSSGGRIFYIVDETLSGANENVPCDWQLVARDAFSGVLLWKKQVPNWGTKFYSGIPGTGAGASNGRFSISWHVGKRLVATGDTVYVTLGAEAPVTALDAATGEIRQTFDDTARADEMLVLDGKLLASVNPPSSDRPPIAAGKTPPPPPPGKEVVAVDTETGKMLWRRDSFVGIRASRGQDPFGRLELAAGDGKVFVLTPESIECLITDSGDTAWKIDRPPLPETAIKKIGFAGMYEFLLEVMLYAKGVVLLAQPEPNTHHTYHTMPGTLYAFDASTGEQMWKRTYGGWGHCTQPDVFVVGDSVWTHVDAKTEYGKVWGAGKRALNTSNVDYRIQKLSLKTGAVQAEHSTKLIFDVGHHHRCYRNKITTNYLLSCRRGVEFVDLESGENYQNHWVRSGCLLGYIPCNGLLYVTPHPCGCYRTSMLTGFNALAPRTSEAGGTAAADRLFKGPAYGKEVTSRRWDGPWPTYRANAARTGAVDSQIPADLKVAWTKKVSDETTSVTAAHAMVFVAGRDDHTVRALSVGTGEIAWSYTAGGRVDSPPTIHEGLAIFGSNDGRVYALTAATGELVWRFDAAANRRMLTAFGQLESPWPVPGSVLIHEGKCWVSAGRSSFLDGGIRAYALDPKTGEVLEEKTFFSVDENTGKQVKVTSQNALDGLLNDIMVAGPDGVFIRQQCVSTDSPSRSGHLFSTGGFLDSTWFNRTFWKSEGVQTSGMMVRSADAVFAVEAYASRGRDTVLKPGTNTYRVMCFPTRAKAKAAARPKTKAKAKKKQRGPAPLWQHRPGIRVTAMAVAGDTLFVGGSPDVVDAQDPHGAWQGRKGGKLVAYSVKDGTKRAELDLPAPPTWDGMAAAGGRLYLSLMGGSVVCLKGRVR